MSIYYKISAPAKLNLNLFVGGKFLDGLHFLKSDICFLELIDKIYLKFSKDDKFYQNKNNTFMINPEKNLIFQAIKIFRSYTKWDKKFEIYLDKNIPIGAGLGGGSADAAATLVLLRKLFNKESNNKMQDAINEIWNFTDELFEMDEVESLLLENNIAVDLAKIKNDWKKAIDTYITEATLTTPKGSPSMVTGGKKGKHSENLALILSTMQHLPRKYPDAKW